MKRLLIVVDYQNDFVDGSLGFEGAEELDERIAARESMLEDYPELRAMYAPGDGNTEVYYLKNARAVICSFTAAPVEIEL